MRVAALAWVGIALWGGCGSDPKVPENMAGSGAVVQAGLPATGVPPAMGSAGVTGAMTGGGVGGGVAPPSNPAVAGMSGGSAAGNSGNAAAGNSGNAAAGNGGNAAAGNAAAGSGGSGAAGDAGSTAAGMGGMPTIPTEKFSFFVTSLAGMQMLSKSDKGFGGDLRYGQATGLAGADKICTDLAEKSMPGAGAKGWRAFLSTAAGGANGGPVHARDRIGNGPWYDRNGRLIAMTLEDLIQQRPRGADPLIIDDLPNENGIPNQDDADPSANDNHDTVTGSNAMGMHDSTPTCSDWTSTETPGAAGMGGSGGTGGSGPTGSRSNGPRIGHSWPARSGMHWIAAHQAPGCAPSVSLVQMGGGSGVGIGNGGGYGGIYCFALMP
jgi:hypothetical protein